MTEWSDAGKAKYKQVRGRIWLGLAALWLVGWYIRLDQVNRDEAATYAACKSAGHWLCANFSAANFDVAMAVVVIASPLLFFPAWYLARRYMAVAGARAVRREAEAEAALERRQQEASRQRMVENDAAATKAREKNSRSEIIMKLGSVNDLVDVLAAEQDPQRRMQVRLGVAQALRELAAKYDATAFAALIQADEATRVTVGSVIGRLEASSLADLVELELLRRAADREQALRVI